jgi:hypothetical protein
VASIYADECISGKLTILLCNIGYDVRRVQDELQPATPGPYVLLRAAELGRVLITNDHDDYFPLHVAWIVWPGSSVGS